MPKVKEFRHTCGSPFCEAPITIIGEKDTDEETYCNAQCRYFDHHFRSVWTDENVREAQQGLQVTWVCDVPFPARGG